MPDKQTRQNTLPVPTILRFEGDAAVDLHFSIDGGQRNLLSLLKYIIGVKYHCKDEWSREWGDYFAIVWTMFETKLDLGLEEELSSLEKLFIKQFFKYLYKPESWSPDIRLIHTRFQSDAYSFYGMLGNGFKIPVIRQRRRRSMKHPTKYVGVGYRDKGAARKCYQDGSPTWTELAQEVSVKQEKATLLRKNISLEIMEPDLVTLTLQRRRNLFEPARKVSFQKVAYKGNHVGYRVKSYPLGLKCGFTNNLSEKESEFVLGQLRCKITDGEYFFL